MTALRKLTGIGLSKFAEYLDRLRVTPTEPPPIELLTDPLASEAIGDGRTVELRPFASKLELAECVVGTLDAAAVPTAERDAGVWTWFALALFDQLVPPGRGGTRNPRQRERLIFNDKSRYHYRHLVATPCRLYEYFRANPDDAALLLRIPVDTHGELTEQFVSRRDLLFSAGFMQAASRLYWDAGEQRPVRGSRGGDDSPGSARRLGKVMLQLDLTWDIYAMPAGAIMEVLPGEFESFRRRGQN